MLAKGCSLDPYFVRPRVSLLLCRTSTIDRFVLRRRRRVARYSTVFPHWPSSLPSERLCPRPTRFSLFPNIPPAKWILYPNTQATSRSDSSRF